MARRRRRRRARGPFRSLLRGAGGVGRWFWRFRPVRRVTLVVLIAVAVAVGEWLLLRWVFGESAATRLRAGFALAYAATVIAVAFAWWRSRNRRRFRVRTLAHLLALTPVQFEEATAALLRDLGYRNVRRVGGAGDLAADILCRDAWGRAVVVQCKRYAADHLIDSPMMQQFIGMVFVHHGAERGIYVTTSRFTDPAADLGRTHDITLLDGDALTRLLADLHERAASRR